MSFANPFDPFLSLGQDAHLNGTPDPSDAGLMEVLDLAETEIEIEIDEEESLRRDVLEEDEASDSEYDSDEIDDIFESQLLSAQQQWEESLEQLNKVLNWVLLPLIGKFMGRRVAKTIWYHTMEYLWR